MKIVVVGEDVVYVCFGGRDGCLGVERSCYGRCVYVYCILREKKV